MARKSKKLIGFELSTRETKYLKRLFSNISHIKAYKNASDRWNAYSFVDPKKRLIGKSQTYTVERMNRLLWHYLARFNRKIFCYSKYLNTIFDSVLLFLYRASIFSIHFWQYPFFNIYRLSNLL